MKKNNNIGLIGANSLVGEFLIPMLADYGANIFAYSRSRLTKESNEINWRNFSDINSSSIEHINFWICLAPIWIINDYFQLIKASSASRVVVLSSTSRFTKIYSGDHHEIKNVERIIKAENDFLEWGNHYGIETLILRPTLIYCLGKDRNVTEIARLIRLFGFFPLYGKGDGLRQPIHAQDVASVCFNSLIISNFPKSAYNVAGAEILSYRELVVRVFEAIGRSPVLIELPIWVFKLAILISRYFLHYPHISIDIVERMNQDLVFDISEAMSDLGFQPRRFLLKLNDLT